MSGNVKVIMPPAYVGLIKAWRDNARTSLDNVAGINEEYYNGMYDALTDVINLIEMRGSN